MYFLDAPVVTLLLFFALTAEVSAFWRLPCRGRTGIARIDPLMQFDEVGDHVHAIHGGQNFDFTSTQATLNQSACTSCAVEQDLSAYWAPALYFMGTDGKTQLVDEVGGMLVYYLLYGDNIKAFPNGFQMIAGDNFRRNFTLPVPDPPKSEWSGDAVTQDALSQKALGFNCLNYAIAPEPSLYRHFLPDKAYLDEHCKDGIRLEVMFPSCWNGKDVDSPNHKDHMAYPNLVMTGTCPPGFETRVPSLFFETIWDTAAFKGQDGQFVLANGDPTGNGYHGDFINAWEEGVLQQAVDTCTNPSGLVEDCAVFKLQDDEAMNKCKLTLPDSIKEEECTERRGGLPGDVPIQYGPQRATMRSAEESASSTSAAPVMPTASPTMPTLTYSAAETKVTDKYGGGLYVEESSTTAPAPTSAPPVEVKEKVASLDDPGVPVATQYFTTGREVLAVVIMQEETTVTVDQLPTEVPGSLHKRHSHIHRHGRRGRGVVEVVVGR